MRRAAISSAKAVKYKQLFEEEQNMFTSHSHVCWWYMCCSYILAINLLLFSPFFRPQSLRPQPRESYASSEYRHRIRTNIVIETARQSQRRRRQLGDAGYVWRPHGRVHGLSEPDHRHFANWISHYFRWITITETTATRARGSTGRRFTFCYCLDSFCYCVDTKMEWYCETHFLSLS